MALFLTLTSVGFLISSPALDSKGRQVRMLRLCNYPLESINSVLAASLALFEQVRAARAFPCDRAHRATRRYSLFSSG